MISENHVTEDWSNDAENTEINDSLTHIQIENCFNVYIISQFLLYFWPNKWRRDFLNIKKKYSNFWQVT